MSIFDDIKRDAGAGTPGKWGLTKRGPSGFISESHQYLNVGGWYEFAVLVAGSRQEVGPVTNREEAHANARRIARVPELERIALAAEKMAALLDECADECRDDGLLHPYLNRVEAAIAAFREAP